VVGSLFVKRSVRKRARRRRRGWGIGGRILYFFLV